MVSRRTLHRAFQHTLGIGPLAYLRLRRLSAVHRALTMAEPAYAGVTRAALDFGFTDLGRFAAFYKRLFGEFPSQTLRSTSRSIADHADDGHSAAIGTQSAGLGQAS
ncbi:helix-turn-helix domain-containing protein [Mesorhizobium sp. M6A.T.Ce.TU.016.01.1.1]|nr:helix-turn-helix domain-containing protein [Mesorhizobium sp. M6A.T.Ce.TU.016.01.1.1]